MYIPLKYELKTKLPIIRKHLRIAKKEWKTWQTYCKRYYELEKKIKEADKKIEDYENTIFWYSPIGNIYSTVKEEYESNNNNN